MQQMTNRVTQVHGIASLAILVCAEDRGEGSSLFRQAITSLHGIPQSNFDEKRTMPLPVASFTGLWKYVVPAALQCDPSLAVAANNQQSKDRIEQEKLNANRTLSRAYSLIEGTVDKQDNNDRAAQLGNAALDAVDPNLLDVPLFVAFISHLRDYAPELADDLFDRGVETIMAGTPPNPANLEELARYLFTAPKLLEKPRTDIEPLNDDFDVGNSKIQILTATRYSTNPDNIETLIDAVMQLLKQDNGVVADPTAAYALGLQLLPRARDLTPDKADDLEKAVVALASQIGTAAQIQAGIGRAENPDQDSGDPAVRDYQLVGRIKSELAAGRIDRARELQLRMTDGPVRTQLTELIKFAEAARAIEARAELAMPLSNLLRSGVKRTLLYAGVISNALQPDAALSVLPLASHDAEPLPAEHRVRLFASLSAALVKSDEQAAISTLDMLVRAYNDVYASPRKTKFDPRAVHRVYNNNTRVDSNTDASLIIAGSRGMYEAVQTERGRHNFMLKVPGVSAMNLASFIMMAGKVDPDRLLAPILGIKDDTTRAAALVRLGDLRIRTAKAAAK
jgi:hypothetical protein